MTESKKPDVNSGMFVARDWRGRYVEVPPGEPQATVCRRLRDFTNGMPEHAVVTGCIECGCAVVTANLFPDKPTICFQCSGIAPLPFTKEDS